eukprot:CAMPEP_0194668798 /NCGR_PEP_ID=MMETSP0295-20121207/4200_1 /TAXON_ID=39354 /ORGANISM="Heterosigma akashiwo, Strain CCMP2393" /LENGTH=211 /DNA_ID=CAMNT_0039551657 /DNA_START=903 /DNA_END=1535 /DNA_ORIENTATION=-
MDEMALRMLNVAPLLADFIVAIAHDLPDAAEKAFKLSYHWVFRCTGKVVMDIISHIDTTTFWNMDYALDIFMTEILNSPGALPSDLRKRVDSSGATLHDAMVEFARSKSPDANLEDTPAPTPSVAPLSTVSGSMAPTCDDLGIQPAPPAEHNVHDDCGAPPTDGHGDPRPDSDHGQISDGPVWPPHVHLLGPNPEDTVQPPHVCALPAPPT